MRVHSLVLLGVVALTGCGDDVSPPGGDGGADMTPDLSIVDLAGTVDMVIGDDMTKFVSATQFNMDKAAAICQHLLMCGKITAAEMSNCIEANTAALGVDEDTEIALGRVRINELQCISAIQGSRCDNEDVGGVYFEKCALQLDKPMQASDGTSACIIGFECINGYCQHATPDGGATNPEGCAGVCQPYKTANAACNPNAAYPECDPNTTFCDSGTSKCLALPALGGDCSATFLCQPNQYCKATATAGVYQCAMAAATGNLGDACDVFQNVGTATPACANGLFCKQGASPTCQTKIATGQPCTPSDAVASIDNQCVDGSACYKGGAQTMATCQAYAGVNGDCDPTPGSVSGCQTTLYCDSATKKCKALIADNMSCDSTLQNCLAGATNCLGSGVAAKCVANINYNNACTPVVDDTVCGGGGPGDFCNPANNRCAIQCN